MGELALQGRDKLTFVVSPPIESFGLWAEQLVAESTGKHGKGILPVADEPLGDAGRLRRRSAVRVPAQRRRARRGPRRAGRGAGPGRSPDHHPRRARRGGPRPDLLLRRVRDRRGRLGARHQPVRPAERAGGQGQHRQGARGRRPPGGGPRRPRGAARSAAEPPHYVAILGFTAPSEEVDAAVAELRSAIRDATKATTTFGYGPRYLHSTGQFHKGGPPAGLFLEFVHPSAEDAEIPGAGYGVRAPEERPGDRRPADPARPRPARRCRCGWRATPRRGCENSPTRVEGGALMKLGFVGLGKMGGNMVHRIHRDSDHEVVAFDFSDGGGERGRGPRRRRGLLARGARREARGAARGLGDGAGGRPDRADRREARRADGRGRHDHRRRQQQLDRRQCARAAARAEGHPLRGRGHVRRRVGPRRWATA